MAVFNGPPRAGSRGGKDQFNWEDVKADKDREYYLGHSVKALAGRWQKGKDVYWYTREQKGDAPSANYDDELRAVKAHEEQLMAEALGIKPKSSHAQARPLEEHERKQLLRRNEAAAAGPSEDGAEDDPGGRGLGYAPGAIGGVSASARLEGYDDLGGRQPAPPPRSHAAYARESSPRQRSPRRHGDADEDRSEDERRRAKRRKREKELLGSPAQHSGSTKKHKRDREDREGGHKERKEHKSHKRDRKDKEHKLKKHKSHRRERR